MLPLSIVQLLYATNILCSYSISKLVHKFRIRIKMDNCDGADCGKQGVKLSISAQVQIIIKIDHQ